MFSLLNTVGRSVSNVVEVAGDASNHLRAKMARASVIDKKTNKVKVEVGVSRVMSGLAEEQFDINKRMARDENLARIYDDFMAKVNNND